MVKWKNENCTPVCGEPRCYFLAEILDQQRNSGVKSQSPLSASSPCLRQEHFCCVFILPPQLSGRVCFIDWLSIKQESELRSSLTLSFTIGFHCFAKWFKLLGS